MKASDLVKMIAAKEGKKHQVKVGDVREIVGIIADAAHQFPVEVLNLLAKLGAQRAKKAPKVG